MASFAQWVEGARLRTLPLAVAPVVIGTAAAYEISAASGTPTVFWGRALLAAIVSLALQVGVNYANDYSDGIRGTDDVRVGPLRLTASGVATPGAVKRAAFLSFGVAALAGLALVGISGLWWAILVGIVCILAAWGYTGGKKPYGYMGLGDVMVFIFFGLVATLGTTFSQVYQLSAPAWVGACSIGLISTSVLMANNIRDIPTDREVGKMTLAVRLGETNARRAFVVMLFVAVLLPVVLVGSQPWLSLTALAALLCFKPSKAVLSPSLDRRTLIPVLKTTGIIGLVFAALFAVGAVLS